MRDHRHEAELPLLQGLVLRDVLPDADLYRIIGYSMLPYYTILYHITLIILYIYTYINMYIYIYIERERDHAHDLALRVQARRGAEEEDHEACRVALLVAAVDAQLEVGRLLAHEGVVQHAVDAVLGAGVHQFLQHAFAADLVARHARDLAHHLVPLRDLWEG